MGGLKGNIQIGFVVGSILCTSLGLIKLLNRSWYTTTLLLLKLNSRKKSGKEYHNPPLIIREVCNN